ncbi:hypothetical protein BN1708_010909 [Verticillium longisporum]|uniref:Uncharacterized protein n=2 Tax=Verticillium longisporum TaxID=100787 RepID=A0A0G4KW55_VERLO|nr:hypothetical protein BN1708_010909 [Verticillium longisporum]
MITLAALVGSNDPDLCADLYTHLLTKPEFSTPEQRQELVRRLREGLFKTISVVGVCKPMSAILAINAREREEDKDRSITREGWQCDDDSLKRGQEWLAKIYTRDTDSTLDLFKDHRDFAWVSERITYGLYLCDRQVLDDFDTEMVVLCSIMIQNLGRNTHWHLRGTRRLGVSFEDTQKVKMYAAIEGHDIAPKFLAHITENRGRVIGHMLERLKARLATIHDMGKCQAVLARLHGLGITHGGLSRHSFLIDDERGRAYLHGFFNSYHTTDQGVLQAEFHSLGGILPRKAEPSTVGQEKL